MELQKISKNDMEYILSNSKSIREVILKFNLSPNGSGGYRNVKKRIVDLGLDIPKYNYYGDGGTKRKIPNSDVFCEKSSYPRQSLKRRIINDNLLEYKCDICDNTGEHNGKSLSLHLDHKNGINNDNRLDNLRFLCPNCHSQTDTYAGKANKKIKETPYHKTKNIYKSKKDKSITSNTIKKQRPRKVERPELEVLLKEIKEMGYSATGRKYGVSDNAVRKWIK
jgi:5-methylcytosine-specific restriction endonuclease McrA